MTKWEEYEERASHHLGQAGNTSATSPLHMSQLAQAQVYATLALVAKTPAPRPARVAKESK